VTLKTGKNKQMLLLFFASFLPLSNLSLIAFILLDCPGKTFVYSFLPSSLLQQRRQKAKDQNHPQNLPRLALPAQHLCKVWMGVHVTEILNVN
jgi:hypothetical protein